MPTPFGPTVVNPVRDLDEAVERANASRYGLAARLRVGAVSVNAVLGFAAVPALPFGGVGDSGFGRLHGADWRLEFSRPKSMTGSGSRHRSTCCDSTASRRRCGARRGCSGSGTRG